MSPAKQELSIEIYNSLTGRLIPAIFLQIFISDYFHLHFSKMTTLQQNI